MAPSAGADERDAGRPFAHPAEREGLGWGVGGTVRDFAFGCTGLEPCVRVCVNGGVSERILHPTVRRACDSLEASVAFEGRTHVQYGRLGRTKRHAGPLRKHDVEIRSKESL